MTQRGPTRSGKGKGRRQEGTRRVARMQRGNGRRGCVICTRSDQTATPLLVLWAVGGCRPTPTERAETAWCGRPPSPAAASVLAREGGRAPWGFVTFGVVARARSRFHARLRSFALVRARGARSRLRRAQRRPRRTRRTTRARSGRGEVAHSVTPAALRPCGHPRFRRGRTAPHDDALFRRERTPHTRPPTVQAWENTTPPTTFDAPGRGGATVRPQCRRRATRAEATGTARGGTSARGAA